MRVVLSVSLTLFLPKTLATNNSLPPFSPSFTSHFLLLASFSFFQSHQKGFSTPSFGSNGYKFTLVTLTIISSRPLLILSANLLYIRTCSVWGDYEDELICIISLDLFKVMVFQWTTYRVQFLKPRLNYTFSVT